MRDTFIEQYPWIGYLFIGVGCLALAFSGFYVDQAYAKGYNKASEIAYEHGMEEGRNEGYDLGFDNGYQDGLEQGRNATLDALEQDEPTVLFRFEQGNNRSIAYAYPAANFSYTCELSKATEWRVGTFTYAYNRTTRCELRHTNLAAEWNDPTVNDQNLARQAREDYADQENETTG
jgi:hypothetical protein